MRTYSIERMEKVHLPLVETVIRESHERTANPYPVERTLWALEKTIGLFTTHAWVLNDGDRIVGYAWGEHLQDSGDLHLHEVYVPPGYDSEPLWQHILTWAGSLGCKRVTTLSFRRGATRGFARLGFEPRATFFARELQGG